MEAHTGYHLVPPNPVVICFVLSWDLPATRVGNSGSEGIKSNFFLQPAHYVEKPSRLGES